MKKIIFGFLLLFNTAAFSQLSIPTNFKVDNTVSCCFWSTTDSRYHIASSMGDESLFNFKFITTSDGLRIGTGYEPSDKTFHYVIMTPKFDRQHIEVWSLYNDKLFSKYSLSLLRSIRKFCQKKQSINYHLNSEL